MTIIDPTLHHQIRIELEYLWSCGFVPFNASIKTIAERFNMSTRTFQRVVKKNGWCFEEWKQTVRVRKVKLLLDCSYSVDSAAEKVQLGRRQLDKIFVECIGITPTLYQRRHMQRINNHG